MPPQNNGGNNTSWLGRVEEGIANEAGQLASYLSPSGWAARSLNRSSSKVAKPQRKKPAPQQSAQGFGPFKKIIGALGSK